MNPDDHNLFQPGAGGAKDLDQADPLRRFRSAFHTPLGPDGQPAIYLCGNSLGLLPEETSAEITAVLNQWARYGVRGWFTGARPWMAITEEVNALLAEIVGGHPDEVVTQGTLTNNIHLMLAAFYKPQGTRDKILAISGGFPSDRYALHTMLRLRGRAPEEVLLTINAPPGEHLIHTEDIEALLARHGEEIALVYLPGLHFATGQTFDMARITHAAHARGCLVGFDLAHAVGNVPLALHDWEVDFAVWCGYKYLSGGPGHGAGLFVHQRHVQDEELLHLGGWWGNDPNTRFEMREPFEPQSTADRFQVSTPVILSLVPLLAPLRLYKEAGLEKIWEKSRRLTAYLETLLKSLPDQPFQIITPREPAQRGNQLSILLKGDAKAAAEGLWARGVVIDERPPNLIRVSPTPLYNTYQELWHFVGHLREVLLGDER
jgi:kynureninase